MEIPIGLTDIQEAAARIAPFVHRTPVMSSETLNRMTGKSLFFKCENFQKIGAFKARGAHNAIFSLEPEQWTKGIVTHSSGNHAAAVALAAKNAGTTAFLVMPHNASRVKIAAVERLGGKITFCEPNAAARESVCAQIAADTGATLIHPFDDWNIIAGQGTAALELLQDMPQIDVLLAPVGGGGLLGGTAIVGSSFQKKVYGAEPSGADDAFHSLRLGQRQPLLQANTVADGLRTPLGEKNFAVIQRHVAAIGTASDEAIIRAMRLIWDVMKIIVEPSCAVPLAVLLENQLVLEGQTVGIVLSGGNIDLDHLPW